MKKTATFYQDGKTIYCVSKNQKKYGMATCNKTDEFNVIIGMKIAFFRMVAKPRSFLLRYSPISSAEKIGEATVWLNDTAIADCYFEFGHLTGYDACRAYSLDKDVEFVDERVYLEMFVRRSRIISITFSE